MKHNPDSFHPIKDSLYLCNQSDEFLAEFESLFITYYEYLYEYIVGHKEDFTPDDPWYLRDIFCQDLSNHEMMIAHYRDPYTPYVMPKMDSVKYDKLVNLHIQYWNFVNKYYLDDKHDRSLSAFCEDIEYEGECILVNEGY